MVNIDDTIGLPNSHPAIEYRQTRTIRRPAWLDRWREAPRALDRLPAVVAQTVRAAYRFPEKTSFRPPKRSPRRPRRSPLHRRDRGRRSSGGRIVRTDPESIPNTRVGEGRQAGLRAATMFRPSPGGATLRVPGILGEVRSRGRRRHAPLSAEPRSRPILAPSAISGGAALGESA